MESSASGAREKKSPARNRALSEERRDSPKIPLETPFDNQSNSDKSSEPLRCKSVKVMLTNACSIISKLDELRERIRCRPPDVIAITESWLHPEISDAEISIDGFSTFRSDRQNRRGGGVLVYISTWLNPSMCDLPPRLRLRIRRHASLQNHA